RTATNLIADPSNRLHISMASIWELAIKVGLKKVGLSVPLETFLTTAITGYGLNVIDITIEDCVSYVSLSFPDPRHRDPFDRMIVIHSQRHSLSVIGVDDKFDIYGVTRLW
ncbi:MAG TPA: type II toxin-antitoxin system VapC family toxin, partial [Gemmata sp.]|nr:type II toxin-antitoxin system VapC family toxin [Gemmata sp.]